MPGCNTGRNIQKYKGSGGSVSTLQDVTDNGNTTTGDIITTSGFFIGDGSKLTGISGTGSAFSFQEISDTGNTTSNTIQFTNTITSLTTSGNIELGHASDTTLARSSAGVVTIEGAEIRTGTVPISKGGTGTTSASAAATALGLGTGDSPLFTAIELGHASDTTLARSSAGVVTIEGDEIRTGTVPISKGGTGATTLDNLITLGTHTTGDFVGTITGGDGIASSGGTTGEDTDHTLSIDTKANGGLVFESGELAVNLAASSITGTLAVSDGGTGHDSYTTGQILVANGTTSLTKLTPGTSGHFLKSQGAGSALVWASVADVGSNTTYSLSAGNFLVGGPFDGSSAATFNVQGDTANTANKLVARDASGDIAVSGLTVTTIQLGHASDTTLARTSACVVTIEGDEIRTGTVPIAKGGTGQTTASAAASALGVGTEDSPQFTAIELGHASDTTLARTSAGVVTIQGNEIRTGTVPIAKGGTGIAGGYNAGDILYGTSSTTTLSKLTPAAGNGDVGSFLKLGTGNIPEWATVSSSGGNYWTQHTNGNDIYYNGGNVGISNTSPTNTFSVGTVVSIQETSTGDVLIVKGGGYFNDDVYIAKRLTVPVGGEIKADTIKVRSLSQKGTTVVAERLVDTISLG